MNNIIWLVYLADIAGSIVRIVNVVIMLSLLLLLVTAFISAMSAGENNEGIYGFKQRIKQLYFKPIIITCCILAAIGCFIPSKNTIYIMAGLSVTQKISETPEAKKALGLLNLGLDKAISKLQENK